MNKNGVLANSELEPSNLHKIREAAKLIKERTGLIVLPVGVKFFFSKDLIVHEGTKKLECHRYCQALMKARHGEHVLLDKDGISCPAAAAAFGFKPLPDGLRNGKGLIGFGITKEEGTGVEMFKGMTILQPGKLEALYLFPLEKASIEPDVVIVEDQIEKLMWFALAYLNVKGGKRVESSTAVLQATCVDATLIPFIEQKMNLSYGCYGCRDATDIGSDESVLGFPFGDLEKIAEYIEYLSLKAIPNSRGKNACAILKKNKGAETMGSDVFQTDQREV